MFPKIVDGNRQTTSSEIESFQRKRHLQLPQTYLQFLLATNGGVPHVTVFPITGMPLNPTGSVQTFLGIGCREPTDDLAYAYDLYAAGFPHGIVPIAHSGSGDLICLDLRRDSNRVAYWDKAHFWSTGEWRESDLYHIADSFEKFVAGLTPDPY